VKATLEFDFSEEKDSFDDALKGSSYRMALDQVWNDVFRPIQKHGYPEVELNKLLEQDDCRRVVEMLTEKFWEVMRENEVEI
jgi:hypothetical protein